MVVVQHLLAGFAQRLLHHLAHQRAPVDAPHVGGRHLAGAEALQVELRRDLGDARIQLLAQLLGRNRNAVDAAEAFARFFNDLHRHLKLPEENERRHGAMAQT